MSRISNRLLYTLRRILKKSTRIETAAVAVDVLCEQEPSIVTPAIFLESELAKIRSAAFGNGLDFEIAKARGASRMMGRTTRVTLRDVVVEGMTLYAQGRRKTFHDRRDVPVAPRTLHLDEAALASSLIGCNFFGHWLGDDCATYLLAAEAPRTVSLHTDGWPDKAVYARLFDQDWDPSTNLFVRKLVLYDDIVQNSNKGDRFDILRRKVRSKITKTNNEIVYIRRGASGKPRNILNEDALVAAMANRGVSIFNAEAENEPFPARHLDARIIIGVEGSQLCHAIYAVREHGGLFVIQPPDRFFNSNLDWARRLGVRYAFVVGEAGADGFSVDVGQFLRTLDLLEEAVA